MGKYGISSNVINRFCRVYNWFLERRKGGKREMMHVLSLQRKLAGEIKFPKDLIFGNIATRRYLIRMKIIVSSRYLYYTKNSLMKRIKIPLEST